MERIKILLADDHAILRDGIRALLADHPDMIVIGEAEDAWPMLLKDYENNELKEKYHCPDPDLSVYIPKNFSSLKSKRRWGDGGR